MGCIIGRVADKRAFDDDRYLSESQSFARDVAVLRTRIAAKKMPVIWLLGDPLAINTHAFNVAERFGFACLDTTRIIKEEASKQSNRGKLVRGKTNKGKKIPDSVMVDLMKERMISYGDCRGYLISCFPLTPKQASAFSREVAPVDCVILLQHKELISASVPGTPAVIPGGVPEGDTKDNDKKKEKDKDKDKEEELVREIVEAAGAKWDLILEKINANEPAADVFLKIEAAIMDRTPSS